MRRMRELQGERDRIDRHVEPAEATCGIVVIALGRQAVRADRRRELADAIGRRVVFPARAAIAIDAQHLAAEAIVLSLDARAALEVILEAKLTERAGLLAGY